MRTLLGCCLFFVGALALGQDKKDSTRVEVKVTVPEGLDSFEGRVLQVSLYEFNPRIADKAANTVEKLEIKNFSHKKGTATVKELIVGAKGIIQPGRSYYVVVDVVQDGKRTHYQDFNGILKVLTDGNPNQLEVKLKQLKK